MTSFTVIYTDGSTQTTSDLTQITEPVDEMSISFKKPVAELLVSFETPPEKSSEIPADNIEDVSDESIDCDWDPLAKSTLKYDNLVPHLDPEYFQLLESPKHFGEQPPKNEDGYYFYPMAYRIDEPIFTKFTEWKYRIQ